jgi:glycosyltransferase involved in cell wall biosynthesis
MKVLHVEGGRNLYGGAHQLLLLIEGLKGRAVENVLACRTGSELAEAARPFAEVRAIKMKGDLDVGLIHRLSRIIHETRPDIVHLHSRIGADVMGGIAARLAGVPVVHSRRVDNPESRLAVALKYRLHDRVIAISAGIERVLLSEGLPADKLRCVRDAIEITPVVECPERDWFHREFGLQTGTLTLGVVAQLIQRKGHHVLLEALPEVLARFPQVKVLFFGKGPLETELRNIVERMRLSGQVHLAGFRDDLARVLPCLDILVHPALREGLGVSLLQASCARLPIVASRVGGIPEAVRDGETGLLVEPGNPVDLAQALTRLLGDDALRQRLGQAGRQWVEEAFSADLMVDGNLTVYRELVGA